MNTTTHSNKVQSRKNAVRASEHSAIATIVLLGNVSLHVLQLPFIALQGSALLIAVLIHQILQERIQNIRPRAAHRIAITNLLLLYVDNRHRPMRLLSSDRKRYIIRVDGNDDATLTKEIDLASPPSNGGIAILREFLEEEAVEAVNRLANYKSIR